MAKNENPELELELEDEQDDFEYGDEQVIPSDKRALITESKDLFIHSRITYPS